MTIKYKIDKVILPFLDISKKLRNSFTRGMLSYQMQKSGLTNAVQHVLVSFKNAALHLIRTGTHWEEFSAESCRQGPKSQATLVHMAVPQENSRRRPEEGIMGQRDGCW